MSDEWWNKLQIARRNHFNRNSERGASVLEMLFAIAITAFAMPFAYTQMSKIGTDMKMMETAKQIIGDSDTIRNYIRLHADEFEMDKISKVETDDENKSIYIIKDKLNTNAFVVIKNKFDSLSAHKITNFIGSDAAVVEDDNVAYSINGWAIEIPESKPGDIVYKVSETKSENESTKYLHRTILSDGKLSIMERDLSMGNFSISNVGEIVGKKLNTMNLESYLIKTPVVATTSLYFINGLNLNPEKSQLPTIRVNGDVIGFRELFADNFDSQDGTLTTDRAIIANKISISDKFEVKSPSARTISGFAGISASNVRTAFLTTDKLTFLAGFGLTVSSELLYTSTPPIKLGSWSWPNSSNLGPKFNKLVLKNLGDKSIVGTTPDFSKILKENWK